MSLRTAFRISVLTPCAVALLAHPVRAQQRPLLTQDPEVIGAGRVLFETGIETGQNARYPLSGLRGDRLALPTGICIGLGDIGELDLTSGYTWFDIDGRVPAPLSYRVPPDAAHTSDIIDFVAATKVKLLREGDRRPSFSIRVATRLPNASNESGLGLDTTDFYFSVLTGKTIRSFRIVGNVGLGILSDPLIGTVQSDAFLGGLSVARAVSKGIQIVGEVTGQIVLFADVPPPGAEPLGEVRAALRYTRGRARFDGGVLLGFTNRSPDVGVMAGVTIVGQAFKSP
jgi:hypothetical protein